MTPWKKLSSNYVMRGPWLTVRADACELANGTVLDPYYVIEERDWVHAVAFDTQGRVPVVRQYRHGATTFTLEFPGGIVDDGESPLDAAVRELREETGCVATNWRHGVSIFSNPCRSTNRVHLFFADNARVAGAQDLDDGEHAEVHVMSLDELVAAASGGEFSNSTHAGLLMYALKEAGRIGPAL